MVSLKHQGKTIEWLVIKSHRNAKQKTIKHTENVSYIFGCIRQAAGLLHCPGLRATRCDPCTVKNVSVDWTILVLQRTPLSPMKPAKASACLFSDIICHLV